jgi:hypothetical protein
VEDARSLRNTVAIGLVSAAAMLFETAMVRVLSVVLWYHFAFLAISIAMLGFGVPGVWLAVRGNSPRILRAALLASAVALPGGLALVFSFGSSVPARAAFVSVVTLATMLALGTAVTSLLLGATGRGIARLYAADLVGAAIGALAVIPLMTVVPTPLIIAGAGLLPLVALVLVSPGSIGPAIAVAAVLAGAMAWGEPFRLRFAKEYDEPPELLYERWTPTARVTVFPDTFLHDGNAFGWGFGRRWDDEPLEQLWLEQDGSAGTPIARLRGPVADLRHLRFDVTNVGYEVRRPGSVCVIGAGGGRDILAALAAGATSVDAVEMNPFIVEVVSGEFAGFSGDPYHLPGVNAIVSEGRSYLKDSDRRYDLIQISLIDSWAATAAGAYALSENYLYTIEAYRTYLRRLTPDGMISTSRWWTGARRLEGIRLAHLAASALELEGVPEPNRHIAVVRSRGVATVLVSLRPFDDADRARLDRACEDRGFDRVWPDPPPPGDPISTVLAVGPGPFEDAGLDVSPPTDDRPFFFQPVGVFLGTGAGSLSNNEQAVVVLRWLMALVTGLGMALFGLPFVLRGRLERHPGFWRGSAYFATIGLAFMFVEIPLLQKAILFLGHPNRATAAVVTGMLLGAGIGSSLAARLSRHAALAFGFLPALAVLAGGFALDSLFRSTPDWSLWARMAATIGGSGAIGLFLGFALPSGMIRFDERDRAWFWAVNGFASVASSVFSLSLSMSLGFVRVGLLAVVLYLVAWLLIRGRDGAGVSIPPEAS